MELSTCVHTIRYSWYFLYNLFEAGALCQALGTVSVDSLLTQKKQYAEVETVQLLCGSYHLLVELC